MKLAAKEPNTADARGKVRITVFLSADRDAVKGNIVRAFTVNDTTVSEVANVIHRALEKASH